MFSSVHCQTFLSLRVKPRQRSSRVGVGVGRQPDEWDGASIRAPFVECNCEKELDLLL